MPDLSKANKVLEILKGVPGVEWKYNWLNPDLGLWWRVDFRKRSPCLQVYESGTIVDRFSNEFTIEQAEELLTEWDSQLLTYDWVRSQPGAAVWAPHAICFLHPDHAHKTYDQLHRDDYLLFNFTEEHKCEVELNGTVLMTPKTKADFRMIQKVCRMEAK